MGENTQNDRPLNDMLRRLLVQILIPVLVPVLVGIGSAAVPGSVMMVRLEERVSTLERDVARHEAAMEKEMKRVEGMSSQLTQRTDDQERRLAHSETSLEGLRDDVTEIKTDVKALLRTTK